MTGRRSALVGALSCAAILSLAPPAGANEVDVNTTVDEYGENPAACSLREAVQAANTNGNFGGCLTLEVDLMFSDQDFDEVDLDNGATYRLNRMGGGVEDSNALGDLDVIDERLAISGNGIATIHGSSDTNTTDDRVIEVHASAGNTLSPTFSAGGLVITGGNLSGAGSQGGAISINGPPAAMGEVLVATIGLVTITGNTSAGVGGGIANESGNLRLRESTVSGNNALGTGGGVDTNSAGGITALENVTVSNNRADSNADAIGSGGGVVARTGGTVTTYNTIVGGNFDDSPSGVVAPDCLGTITSGGYNLIGNTSPPDCTFSASTGDKPNVSPGLAPLALIPGAGLSTVLAHDLLPGSQARDAGNPAAPVSSPAPGSGVCGTLAQNFGPRPQGPACDIGSVEADFIPPVAGAGVTLGSCSGKTATIAGGRATISGTAGNDTITGTSAADVISGGAGNDTIRGLGGKDVICGDAGKDNLIGGGGNDRLLGGAGKDKLKGGGGRDTCIGAGARDTASACETARSI